jgi:hypothetical protein
MHDPSFLALDIRPIRLDVWHDEPGGQDAFTVCGRPPQTGPARLLWVARHARHLHFRFWPFLRIKRWIGDHCAECGRRFLWKDARHGYQSHGPREVYHDQCMSLRHVRDQLNDLTALVRFKADSNAKWRAEYRLKGLDDQDAVDAGSSATGKDSPGTAPYPTREAGHA